MLTDLNRDWMNAPVKNGLTEAERQRRLELYFEQARQRKREAEAAEEMLFAAALVLAQRDR